MTAHDTAPTVAPTADSADAGLGGASEDPAVPALAPTRLTRTAIFSHIADDQTGGSGSGTDDADTLRRSGLLPRRHEKPAIADAQAYKQAGNAVCVGAVQFAHRLVPDDGERQTAEAQQQPELPSPPAGPVGIHPPAR